MDDGHDEEMYSDSDEELDTYNEEEDTDYDSEDAELDDLSERELEEMAASTQRSLFMVQMQLASRQAAEEQEDQAQRQLVGLNVDNNNNQDVVDSGEDAGNALDRWHKFIHSIPQSRVLKITDQECTEIITSNINGNLLSANQIMDDLVAAVTSPQAYGLTHVIIGGAFLQTMRGRQQQLFQAVWSKHATTLTYLKLGTNHAFRGNTTDLNGLYHASSVVDMENLISVLQRPPSMSQRLQLQPLQPTQLNHGGSLDYKILLTEIEISGFSFTSVDQVENLTHVLSCCTRLKQLNLLEFQVEYEALQQYQRNNQNSFILNSVLCTATELPNLDECRLTCRKPSSTPLISSPCLAHVFNRKPKWWRLGLDGLGLDDQHCKVISQAMSNDNCKAGDLLSLTMNPGISSHGWNQIFDVLFQKQRMGLVKVDDKSSQATFNLVRSMNNIHGRLSFLESGTYTSRERWIEWLAKLSQISWEDEAHKANYLWFTLLERPDFVHT